MNNLGKSISKASAVDAAGSKVYVANAGDNTVSVIDTATNTVAGTIPVGSYPSGVAVTPDGRKLYVITPLTPQASTLSVIDTATKVVSTIPINVQPTGLFGGAVPPELPPGPVELFIVAFSPDGSKAYVNFAQYCECYPYPAGGVLVIDTATNSVIDTIWVGPDCCFGGLAGSLDGSKLYIMVYFPFGVASSVAVIDTVTDTVTASISPLGNNVIAPGNNLAVTPDGSKLYVSIISGSDYMTRVSVIETATNTVVGLPIIASPQPFLT
jgi:YVTN family beta-propeller protein